MQEARDEVLAIYRAYGLDRSGAMTEGEDHVAYELEFLQTMAGRAASALRDGDLDRAEALAKAQKAFMADHLMKWVGKLAAQMRHFSKTGFYQGVASLLYGACKEYDALLVEMLG